MKVLGIFTGRPKSTTEWMTKAALLGAAEEGAEVEIINLRDLQIKPCTGCNNCLHHLMSGKGVYCMHHDDIDFLNDKIIEADGLVVAAALYEKAPPSEYKAMCDRLGPSHDVAILGINNMMAMKSGHPENCVPEKTFITRPVSYIAHGGSEWTTLGLPNMNMFSISHGFKNVDQLELPWDYSLLFNDETIERLKESGRCVARNCGKPESEMTYIGDEGYCPICHNNTMVLGKGTDVTCAVCGMRGKLSLDAEGNMHVTYPESEYVYSHMTLTGKQNHGKDLGGITEYMESMDKAEFMRRKSALIDWLPVTKPQH